MREGSSWSVPSLKGAVFAYLSSLFLTILSYSLSSGKEGGTLFFASILLGLAFLQLVIQFIGYFQLHREPKPKWSLFSFFFMLLIFAIIVIGSLLIMASLDYRMES